MAAVEFHVFDKPVEAVLPIACEWVAAEYQQVVISSHPSVTPAQAGSPPKFPLGILVTKEHFGLLDEGLWRYPDDAFIPHGRAPASTPYVPLYTEIPDWDAHQVWLFWGLLPDELPKFQQRWVYFLWKDEALKKSARLCYQAYQQAGLSVKIYK